MDNIMENDEVRVTPTPSHKEQVIKLIQDYQIAEDDALEFKNQWIKTFIKRYAPFQKNQLVLYKRWDDQSYLNGKVYDIKYIAPDKFQYIIKPLKKDWSPMYHRSPIRFIKPENMVCKGA